MQPGSICIQERKIRFFLKKKRSNNKVSNIKPRKYQYAERNKGSNCRHHKIQSISTQKDHSETAKIIIVKSEGTMKIVSD